MIKIGSLLRAQRHRRRLTQREVAEAVGCGVLHYTKIETSASHPSIELLEKILEFLNCDIDSLVAPETDPHRQKLLSVLSGMTREMDTQDLELAVDLVRAVHHRGR